MYSGLSLNPFENYIENSSRNFTEFKNKGSTHHRTGEFEKYPYMKGFFDQYELLSNRLYEEKIIIPNILTNTKYRFNRFVLKMRQVESPFRPQPSSSHLRFRSYVSSPTITPSLSPSTLIVKVKRPPNRCQSRTENGDIAIESQTVPLANKPDNTE